MLFLLDYNRLARARVWPLSGGLLGVASGFSLIFNIPYMAIAKQVSKK